MTVTRVPELPADTAPDESGASAARPTGWTISWNGYTYTESDLTGAHVALITAGRLVDDWDFNPTSGPMRLLYVLAAFVTIEEQRPLANVLRDLLALPAAHIVDSLSVD